MILLQGVILIVVILIGSGIVYLIRERYLTFQMSQKVAKQVLLKSDQFCKTCEKRYYVCPICGCQFDNELDQRRCFDWDLIIRREHKHKYLHNHEDEET